MKTRLLTICLGSSVLLACLAQAENYSTVQGTTTSSMERLGRITGATVQNTQGQVLGQIQDLVANTTSGNIQFAILSLNREANQGLLTAVPWQLLRQTGPNTYILNATPQQLETAQTFTVEQWPDFSRPDFASRTYAHYNLNPTYPVAVGGNVVGPSGTIYGSEEYYEYPVGYPWIRPQPDGKNTFPFLHRHNR